MTLDILSNIQMMLHSPRIMTFYLIFGYLIVIFCFQFTKYTIRRENVMYLGCKVTHGLYIQRCWMGLSVFHVCVFGRRVGLNPSELDDKTFQ